MSLDQDQNQNLQGQIDQLKKRLDAFNASQTIPLPVDLAWQNRGFVKTNFFVGGTSQLPSNGEYYLTIPGSDRNSLAFITPFIGSAAMEAEMEQAYATNNFGASTSQFDITNPAGDTFRYTWDGTGTNPNINATTLPIGSRIYVFGQNFNVANNNAASRPFFSVTGSGANYFEVENTTPGVAESNKTLGTGSIIGGPLTDTYALHVSGTATNEFAFVVFLLKSLYIEN